MSGIARLKKLFHHHRPQVGLVALGLIIVLGIIFGWRSVTLSPERDLSNGSVIFKFSASDHYYRVDNNNPNLLPNDINDDTQPEYQRSDTPEELIREPNGDINLFRFQAQIEYRDR